jgi:hypothetical protein
MLAGGSVLPGQESILGGGVPAYDGPSILGRSGPMAGVRGNRAEPIHFQASAEGSYDSSILGFAVNEGGQFRPASSYGVTGNVGIGGRKLYRRSFVGLDYGGSYSHYTRQSFFNGSNHFLNLAGGAQFGPKWQVFSTLQAGTSNRFVGNSPYLRSNEFEIQMVPVEELFDSRSYFLANQTTATYNFNRRESVRFGGFGSTVRRRARGLADMKSYGANGDWVRRVSRRTSIGVSYMFSHYDFEKIFGESDIHTLGVHMGRKFGRDWQFNLGLTGAKQSTVGVRSIELDPVLAAILGRSSGREVFESNNLLYGYSVGLSRTMGRSTVSAGATRGINPGNGYFMTAITQSAGVSFQRSVTRDFSVTASAGYSRMTSLGFASGAFSGWSAGVAANRKITNEIGIVGRYDWRTFDLRQTTFGRTGYRLTVGLSYHPRGGPAGLF